MSRLLDTVLMCKWRDDHGNIAVMAAGMLSMLVALTAITVDAGHLHFRQKDLQRAADEAALAASLDTSRAEELVQASLASNGFDNDIIEEVRVGEYNPFGDLGDRFRANQGTNAVEVVLENQVEMTFLGAVGGRDSVEIGASAVAAYIPEVGFSASSGVLNAQITNQLLSALTGGVLNLTSGQYDALGDEQVDILDLLDQIAEETGSSADTYQELLEETVSAGDVLDGLASTLTLDAGASGIAIGAVETIASEAGVFNLDVPLGNLIELGSLGARPIGDPDRRTDASTGFRSLDVLLNTMNIAGAGQLLSLGTMANVPGLLDVAVYIALDDGALSGESSGGAPLVVGTRGTQVHAAAGQVLLDIDLFGPAGLFGFLDIDIPLYVELGGGNVTLTDVECGFDPSEDTIMTFEASASLAKAYIADIDPSMLGTGNPITSPDPVQILRLGPIVVDAYAEIDALGSGPQQVTMTMADIEAGNTSITGNEETFESLFGSLSEELQLTIGFGGGGLGLHLLTGFIFALLNSVTSTLDPLVFGILQSLGLRAGYVELAPTDVRCGTPVIVI